MGDPKALTLEQKAEAIRLVMEGQSMSAVAKRIGCSKQAISTLCIKEDVPIDELRLKRMAKANRDYSKTARLELINKFFDKAEYWLENCDKPSQFQALALALACLIDKRRLEDGQATARTESVNNAAAIERLHRAIAGTVATSAPAADPRTDDQPN